MKQQETIAGRIVRNVNKVLEVIPRTLNSEAEVIKLNFSKPRKAKRRASARKTVARKVKKVASTAKRRVSKAIARKRKPMKSMTRKSKTASRPVSRAA